MLLYLAHNVNVLPLQDIIMQTLAESVPELVLVIVMLLQIMRFMNNIIAIMDGNSDRLVSLLVEMSAMCQKVTKAIQDGQDRKVPPD